MVSAPTLPNNRSRTTASWPSTSERRLDSVEPVPPHREPTFNQLEPPQSHSTVPKNGTTTCAFALAVVIGVCSHPRHFRRT
ncbi:cell division protein [Sesbania bispinosa]|nr:cell division protein [Sesbania bispinosa]